jgi:hypothetical protein
VRRRYEKGQLVWVAPGSVRYDRADIDLLLPWLLEMREGAYPAEPSGGYVEGKRAGVSSHAFYESACQVAAEIDNRLAMTGTDHYLVEEYYIRYNPEENDKEIIADLAHGNNMPIWEVRRRINSAVSYISSGPCPRWLNCLDCPRYQSCRRKKRVGVSYRDWTHYKNKEDGRKLKYTKKVYPS